jgi:Family of unknown function (DUF5681)
MGDIKPHEAGYMKPPRKNRFEPGQSGNPAGRPKLDDPYATLQKVLGHRITVTGETRKMTVREALIRRLRDRALAGDKRAMALQKKILGMAAAALPEHRPVDTTAAKEKFARMMGPLPADNDDQDATDG